MKRKKAGEATDTNPYEALRPVHRRTLSWVYRLGERLALPESSLWTSETIPTHSVHIFVFTGRKICGAAGSPWKMYVSPVHAIMVLHNVKTNVVIWDYKAKDQDLVPVVRDIIVGDAGAEAKKRIALERTKAWEQNERER